MASPTTPDDGTPTPTDPRPGVMATGVVALEAAALVGVALWLGVELLVSTPQNVAVARGSTLYFVVASGLAALLAIHVRRRSRWAHGPAVFLQLLGLLLSFTMTQARFWPGALVLSVVAASGLAALLSPSCRAEFGRGSLSGGSA